MRYMVVIEEGPTSVGAYIPDLPGCIAVGESSQEVLQLIQKALKFTLRDLKKKVSAFQFLTLQARSLNFKLNTELNRSAVIRPFCIFKFSWAAPG